MASIITTLNQKSLIEYIPDLQQSSNGIWRCSCEIHGGSNESSFAVFPGNSFYCFSCGAHGQGLISYVMQRDGIPFDVAVHNLCDDFGLTIDDSDDYHEQMTLADRNKYWMTEMEKNVDTVREYLHKRGITDEYIEKYHLGYSEKNHCLSIPIINAYGIVIGY